MVRAAERVTGWRRLFPALSGKCKHLRGGPCDIAVGHAAAQGAGSWGSLPSMRTGLVLLGVAGLVFASMACGGNVVVDGSGTGGSTSTSTAVTGSTGTATTSSTSSTSTS